MRIRSFTVPFSQIVPEDAHELEFGPDDYLVVRPIFGLPAVEIVELTKRMQEADTDDKADALVVDVLRLAVVAWSLVDDKGEPIPRPTTRDDLNALPGVLGQSIYQFLASYRGDAANPTTRS